MFQQLTLVQAMCDYCCTSATAPREEGDVTLLFADETEAREVLGLDNNAPTQWRQLDNGLIICGRCGPARDCVLAGGHPFTDWAPCSCEGWLDAHATHEAVLTGVCAYEVRICPQCHTTENRLSTTTTSPHRGGTR